MPSSKPLLFGAIEAGGTKFVCAIGTGPNDVRVLERFPTTTPEETLGRVIDFFQRHPEPIAALGVGSFGPVDPNPSSPTYGYITTTPKPGWAHIDVAGTLHRALNVPVAFDTDVNAAALGEHRWGAGRGLHTFVYLTIGTGIGGGIIAGGRRHHGHQHPEIGHLLIPRLPEDDRPGCCPFHGDCLEGLASGPALQARWGRPAPELPPDHVAWEQEARYLAMGLVNLILTLSPQRLILGGGVMQQMHLFPRIRQYVVHYLNGYVSLPNPDTFIVPPMLGDRAGVLGALALAEERFIKGY